MKNSNPIRAVRLGLTIILGLVCHFSSPELHADEASSASKKLYWFVPDGMRADPDLFDIYQWAEEGKLPNIRKMMKKGTYGFCQPTFPSHTPANFATMFTGAYPEVHGVNDGPMRVPGQPLQNVSLSGFSSTAKKVEPIWVTLERQGDPYIALLSVPGSTPPELNHGLTIRGRWGRWGADFHSVIVQDADDPYLDQFDPKTARLFFAGPQLTERVHKQPAKGWAKTRQSDEPIQEIQCQAWGTTIYARLYDRKSDGKTRYDRVDFATDKHQILCTLKPGDWSDWLPITLRWKIPNGTLEQPVPTFFRIKVIRLEPNGTFRFRLVFNNLNRHVTDPPDVAAPLLQGAGPMVDFVDNFPPQLIYYLEDKEAFLEEAVLSLDWHRHAASWLLRHQKPDVFIHNIYTPNQMLTSRWWMGYLDPTSARYDQVTSRQRELLWKEVQMMYRKLDRILGEYMRRADKDTFVVLSSDHGAIPLDTSVRLNNLFARNGLLKFTKNAAGELNIDWKNTQAIFLKMHAVYLHPDGLDGDWVRGSGPAYEALRDKVRDLLLQLRTVDGQKPVIQVANGEDASAEFNLSPDRTGDLIIANQAGFGWTEEVTEDMEIFSTPLKTGYKQAVLAGRIPGMWTPFMIMGPGVKEGLFLGNEPIQMVDQYPTIMHLMNRVQPDWVQGNSITNAGIAE